MTKFCRFLKIGLFVTLSFLSISFGLSVFERSGFMQNTLNIEDFKNSKSLMERISNIREKESSNMDIFKRLVIPSSKGSWPFSDVEPMFWSNVTANTLKFSVIPDELFTQKKVCLIGMSSHLPKYELLSKNEEAILKTLILLHEEAHCSEKEQGAMPLILMNKLQNLPAFAIIAWYESRADISSLLRFRELSNDDDFRTAINVLFKIRTFDLGGSVRIGLSNHDSSLAILFLSKLLEKQIELPSSYKEQDVLASKIADIATTYRMVLLNKSKSKIISSFLSEKEVFHVGETFELHVRGKKIHIDFDGLPKKSFEGAGGEVLQFGGSFSIHNMPWLSEKNSQMIFKCSIKGFEAHENAVSAYNFLRMTLHNQQRQELATPK